VQLLTELQQARKNPVWDDHPDLLVWLVLIGGAFAPTKQIKQGYVAILALDHDSKYKSLYATWQLTKDVLEDFIWSPNAFEEPVKRFWGEYFSALQSDTAFANHDVTE